MADEHPDTQSQIDEYVARLKSIIPPLDHEKSCRSIRGWDELLNDPSACH